MGFSSPDPSSDDFEERQEARRVSFDEATSGYLAPNYTKKASPDTSRSNFIPSTINPAATAWLFAFIFGGGAWASGESVIAGGIAGLLIGYFIRQILKFAVIASVIFVIYVLIRMSG